eukprot:scaffold41657_cov69-Phaeocystis_antarctica.AAC.4
MDQPWPIVSSTRATWTNHGPSSAALERHGPTMVHRQQHPSDVDHGGWREPTTVARPQQRR